ncbi:MAG: AidA/PixA family protein [Bacteroidota bacterium]
MSQINILIAVDGATLAQRVQDGSLAAGTSGSPTGLGAWSSSDVFISMVTQNSNVTNGSSEGASELSITCNSGDELQWSIVSFDMNTGQTPYLYNGNFNCTNPAGAAAGITPLTYLTTEVVNYFPPTANPTGTPAEATNTFARAIGTVTTPGQTLQYTLSFVLVNNSNGNIIGYFSWDPFIVTNPA